MNQMIMIYVFLLQLVVLYLIIFCTKLSVLEPISIFGLSWILNAFLLAVNYLNFHQAVFTLESFLFASFGIWMFVIGAVFAKSVLGRYKELDIRNIDLSLLNSKKWMYIFEVFIFVYIISIFLIYALPGSLSFDLSSLRQQHWENYENYNRSSTGILEIARALARCFAIFKFISFPFLKYVRYQRRHVIGALLSGLFLLLETYLEGGRGMLVFIFTTMIYLFILTRRNGRLLISDIFSRQNIRIALRFSWLLVIVIYVLMVWFPKNRNPLLLDNFGAYLSYGSRASLSSSAESVADIISPGVTLPFFFSLTYFTTPIPTLTFFFENSDFTHWNYLGAYNFPLFNKLIELITSQKTSWLDIRYRIAEPLARLSYAINPWATGFRDLIIDFGIWGSLIFLFFFGFACQILYNIVFRKPRIEMVLLMSQIISIAIFFGFYSSFFLGFVMYPIIIIILIMIIRPRRRLIFNPSKRN